MRSQRSWVEDTGFRMLSRGLYAAGRLTPARQALMALAESGLRRGATRPRSSSRQPLAVTQDKLDLGRALLGVVDRALADDRLSKASFDGLVNRLLGDVLYSRGDQDPKADFIARHGCSPPDFLTISPGKACNLRCIGCYANAGTSAERLDWASLTRIVAEARQLWGTRFFVISGGEPFAYRDAGKGLLDLAAENRDCFFLAYTNGTLIGDGVAARLAELGNLTPAISVEGLRERTDARRGAGVFDKVLAAMRRLRNEKVVYGLSITATSQNAEEILGDELVDFFFGEMGALYAFLFHYMPIGRAPTLALMPTPQQRMLLLERVWSLVRERRLLIADFWNSGTATNGCIAGGRPGGYLYIDWNGAVSPCVFVPYSAANIKDVYARGGTLDDVWAEPFFAAIRSWQRGYGYRECGERYERGGNWHRPCLIRDHHRQFRRIALAHRAQPNDAAAAEALADPAYAQGLAAFDDQLAALSDPAWRERYVGAKQPTQAPAPASLPAPARADA